MIENLSIFHIEKDKHQLPFQGPAEEWALFETCQRKIYISMAVQNSNVQAQQTDILTGEAAYLTLLNILCGLESRIVGETEVFGQFKLFADMKQASMPFGFERFKRIAQKLMVDVKEIRSSYLQGIGHRSYGALTAHYAQDCNSISILGAGQLAQKALPYLNSNGREINLFMRNPAKTESIPARLLKQVKVHKLSNKNVSKNVDGLIIAAPMSTSQIESWMTQSSMTPKIIIDLRDQTQDARLMSPAKLITLDDLFCEIEQTSLQFDDQIENATKRITELTKERFAVRYFRPFGWEDICA